MATNEPTTGVPSDVELARSLDGDFRSEYRTVDDLRLHYVTGGTGRPLLLLPGWPQTWWQYHKVMPALAAAGREVIAVDLPGMGGSDKPESGYDKKSMAAVIHGFVRELGYDRVDLAGHDMGAYVAFSFAANYPEATGKVALLDMVHPDPSFSALPMLPIPGASLYPWWFAFNQVDGLPEQLLAGRTRYLIDWIFDHYLLDPSTISPLDRAVFADRYDSPGAIRGGNGWYQTFNQDIADLATYKPVAAPILGVVSMLGDGMFAELMKSTLATFATDAQVVVVPDSGHYFIEELPRVVIEQFGRFFR